MYSRGLTSVWVSRVPKSACTVYNRTARGERSSRTGETSAAGLAGGGELGGDLALYGNSPRGALCRLESGLRSISASERADTD